MADQQIVGYTNDGQALVSLPGGGAVSVAFLAGQGVPGYTQNANGTYSVPMDATFTDPFTGTSRIPVSESQWASPIYSQRTDDEKEGAAGGSASVKNMLRLYGLEELIPQVDGWIRQGLSWPEIEAMLRDPSTAAGKVFDKYYPEVRLRAEKGLRPMAVDEIQRYRQTVKRVMKAAGLPDGFYDSNDDFTRFMVNDLSPEEVESRIMDGYVAVMNSPVEVRSELERLYGVQPGQLVAFFLDPDKATTLIQRDVAAAKVGGAAIRTGFGQVSQQEAERLTDLGVTDNQAEQGFAALATNKELAVSLDRGEDTISRGEQLGAVFEGNAAAQEKLSRRQRRRIAQFSGGGSLATSREGGFSGLSTAR